MVTNTTATNSISKVDTVSSKLILGLILSSVLCALLAVFQWMELIVAQRGGALSCSINEVFNCAAVWNAAFAKAIHAYSFVPVAGWGLIWSLGAMWSALRLNQASLRGEVLEGHLFSVRLFSLAGILSTLILAAVSFSLGAVCLTCIATYWLVLCYAVCAYLLNRDLLPADKKVIVPEVAKAIGMSLLLYLLTYYPGTKTPQKPTLALSNVVAETAPAKADSSSPKPRQAHAEPEIPKTVEALVANFPPESKQALSDALTRIRIRPQHDVSQWPIRFIKGSKDAPAKMVEFTDIKCGHCARLVMELKEMERLLEPGLFSLEPRQFPLDYECNKSVDPKMTDGSGVRCAAAKALICLEGDDAYWTAQLEMFKQGTGLTKKKIVEIATSLAKNKLAIPKCMDAASTQKKLDEDIAYATKYELHGTPLVLINGKEVEPIGALMFALVLSGGNLDAPAFKALPPPSSAAFRDPHEGHGH